MKNLKIEVSEVPFKNKSWEELAGIIFDLITELKELKTKMEDVKKQEEYWFQRSEEWRLKYMEMSENNKE